MQIKAGLSAERSGCVLVLHSVVLGIFIIMSCFKRTTGPQSQNVHTVCGPLIVGRGSTALLHSSFLGSAARHSIRCLFLVTAEYCHCYIIILGIAREPRRLCLSQQFWVSFSLRVDLDHGRSSTCRLRCKHMHVSLLPFEGLQCDRDIGYANRRGAGVVVDRIGKSFLSHVCLGNI